MALRPAAAHAASLTGSLMRSPHAIFMVLCLAMGAALHAQPFATAAAEIRLHQDVYVCVVIAVAGLFYWAILSIQFSVAHAEGEPTEGETDVVPGVDRSTVAEAPTSSKSGRPLQHFVVLCLTTGALLHVEALALMDAAAAAAFRIHPGIVAGVVLTATVLLNWVLLDLNFHVARRAAERDRKNPRRAAAPTASAASSPHHARLSFLLLVALISVSWFVEPFAPAAELWLSEAVVIILVLLFAALFNLSVHLFRFFFWPDPPSAVAAGVHGHGVGAINAGVIGICIASLLLQLTLSGASASASCVR